MQTNNQIIESVKQLAVNDKLLIVEAILKSIRESEKELKAYNDLPKILDLAGSISESEAIEWQNAIDDGRKINLDEW